MATATGVDLRGDFAGYVNLNLPEPTPEGRQEFTLYAGQIDTDAESFFGRGFCHWLAGAVHSITGWDLFTVDYRRLGEDSWAPAHSGVLTPAGTVLDIFGEHHRQDVCDRYLHDGADTRPRVVAGPDMPGDVITGIDHLRGDHLWWANKFGTPGLQGIVLHFARLLLDRHGYGDHIREDARPGAAQSEAPQPKSDTPPAPNGKGTVMSSIEENAAQLAALVQQLPLGLLAGLAEQPLPGELAAAREATVSAGPQLVALAGQHTHAAGTAGPLFSQAVAKLDRAAEAFQEFQRHVGIAAEALQQAASVVEQSARYHAAG